MVGVGGGGGGCVCDVIRTTGIGNQNARVPGFFLLNSIVLVVPLPVLLYSVYLHPF